MRGSLHRTVVGMNLVEIFGQIDIYLFDQLLKGRISASDRILDTGCGSGRNAEFMLRQGWNIWAVDSNPSAVAAFRSTAADCGRDLEDERVQVAALDALPFGDGVFDVVVCSAVLHFADDDAHFERMVTELFRVLRAGGVFFARLASSEGIVSQVTFTKGRRARLPDGSSRYLVDEQQIVDQTSRYGVLLDPLKTTIVHGQRAMMTWVVRKS